MSLIDDLDEKVKKGTFSEEDVEELVDRALSVSLKSNKEDLTDNDLYEGAMAGEVQWSRDGDTIHSVTFEADISAGLREYVINYINSKETPAQQEASAQEPAPEAPQAEAPPDETPAQQEAPAQGTAPEAPQASAEPSKTPKTSEDPPKEASEKKKEASKKLPTKKTNYHYSFSGADCDVYAYRSADEFTHLKTIATLSTSIYESKSPVRVLGSAGPVGYTGSIRTIAGSMVFVLTGDHPLRELLEFEDAVLDETFRKFDDTKEEGNIMLSGMAVPFNILVIYKNEVGAQLMYRLEEVEIISEGIVSSVNDMITEMVFQFVALDMKQISAKE